MRALRVATAVAVGTLSPCLSDAQTLHETRPLAAQGLDNVIAFTRLTGYVRFFYPGDSVLTTNWDDFVIRGMRAVESAPSADSLAATLRVLYGGVAHELQIVHGARTPAAKAPSSPNGDEIVFWRHCGYGVLGSARMTIYRSERVSLRIRDAVPKSVETAGCGSPRPFPIPDPATPFVAPLGNDLTVIMPLALYRRVGLLSFGNLDTYAPQPPQETFGISERATRLADVALLWMVPQHFYPYFDIAKTDWPAALRDALQEAAVAATDTAFDATLERLIAKLHDGHGNVFNSARPLAGPDVRLGWIENRVIVTAVGNSAAVHGIHVGDEVTRVDGVSITDALRARETRVSGATPQWIRDVSLRRLLAGPRGTTTRVEFRDAFATTAGSRTATLPREAGPLPSEQRPPKVAELRPGLMYVDLDRVTDADIDAAMPRLEKAAGIIIDMRGYPQHVNTAALLAQLADSTISSAQFELPLIVRPDHEQMLFSDVGWRLRPQSPRLHAKIAFLAGPGSISYAESTLGVVEENHLGEIVGETTAGTNGNIDPFTLPGGYRVVFTGMRVVKRDGTPHHGVGIKPTIPVSRTIAGVRAGHDEVLERAIQYLSTPARITRGSSRATH
ncbi:MAG TPA: S41 family peptidase [Gemmatimonadaceae bacterium]